MPIERGGQLYRPRNEIYHEAATGHGIVMTTRKLAKKSTKKGNAVTRRARHASPPARARWGLLGFMVLLCTLVLVYPPWRDVWTNFEGFRLHAPIAYGPFWSPPHSVFPAPRTIAVQRLGEEVAGVIALGLLLYWLMGRGRKS